ncbi:hypothetical protein ACTXT7_000919 [Hymenolepis weldensis]
MMNRKSGKFDVVLDSLSFSSSSDNNVGGLDEALQQFAAKKAQAIRSRRGPIEGIPDDESVPGQFEIAEDAMLSAHLIDDNEDVKPVNLPSSAPTGDVSHSIKKIDILSDEISSQIEYFVIGYHDRAKSNEHELTYECGKLKSDEEWNIFNPLDRIPGVLFLKHWVSPPVNSERRGLEFIQESRVSNHKT